MRTLAQFLNLNETLETKVPSPHYRGKGYVNSIVCLCIYFFVIYFYFYFIILRLLIYLQKNLAIGTENGCVQLWDVESEKRVRTLHGHSSRVGVLAWNACIFCDLPYIIYYLANAKKKKKINKISQKGQFLECVCWFSIWLFFWLSLRNVFENEIL